MEIAVIFKLSSHHVGAAPRDTLGQIFISPLVFVCLLPASYLQDPLSLSLSLSLSFSLSLFLSLCWSNNLIWAPLFVHSHVLKKKKSLFNNSKVFFFFFFFLASPKFERMQFVRVFVKLLLPPQSLHFCAKKKEKKEKVL